MDCTFTFWCARCGCWIRVSHVHTQHLLILHNQISLLSESGTMTFNMNSFFFIWTRNLKWYWLVEQMNLLSNSLNYGHGTWWSSRDQSWVEAGHRAGHRTKSGGTRVAGHLILAWAELVKADLGNSGCSDPRTMQPGLVVRGWGARVEKQSSDKYDLISNKNH